MLPSTFVVSIQAVRFSTSLHQAVNWDHVQEQRYIIFIKTSKKINAPLQTIQLGTETEGLHSGATVSGLGFQLDNTRSGSI